MAFKATVSLISPGNVQHWKIHLAFSKTVTLLQVPKATAVRVNEKYFTVTRAPWASSTLKYGEKLDIEFIAYVQGEALPCITALFTWKGTLITSSPPTEDPSTPAITTEEPASVNPSTVQPSTGQQSAGQTTTGPPCTCHLSTGEPSTGEPSTTQPSSGQPSTGQQSTANPFTGQPSTVQPSTEQCPIVTPPGGVHAQKANVSILERWPVAFKATVSLISPGDVQQWKIHLAFSKTVTLLQVPKATAVRVNDKYFIVTRAPWASSTLKYGEKLDIEFIAYVQGQALSCITALFTWKGTIVTSSPPPTYPSTPAITTEEPAGINLTTVQPSTGQTSTGQPSTAEPFTGQSSTLGPSSTDQPSTGPPSAVQPCTCHPSTGQLSTVKPFTGQPSTVHPSTEQCPIVTPPGGVHAQKANVRILERWPVAFKATVSLISPGDVQQWKIHLAFSKTVTLLQVPKATAVRVNEKYFTVTRAPWASSTLKYGEKLDIEFIAYVQGEALPCITALFTWKGTLITSSPPTEDPSTPAITTEEPASVNPSTVQPSHWSTIHCSTIFWQNIYWSTMYLLPIYWSTIYC